MTPRYTLKVLTEFASAHSLRDYPGDCRRLHGHNWKVEVEVVAHALDSVGMGIDFKVIKRAAAEVGDRLDHHYLNEVEPFDRINPTAENLAAYFFQELATLINDDRVKISAVTLWETDRASVRYTED
ncbi:6-carboxytetrahydropterin synthase QueD [Solemya pervernicosa gill symbiont]|uniref:6-carboxy-5,6,7,8-tetrahydropterin synthase n=2 Tax=Gammaproteobacteria incertae sedis TaxID=118884 RepID=A0A1T2L154_9GAMM|nr:6-carboxytetrahydropterin synthase QueD [Candidatus Reidiella endopervernicosa]OOZ38829.1 6-carboxytetrahydropterin synthase QueD [Solemya pervernicosa gill symbiont]QKQ27424.1 6-carboxytetrahydropterin synthase QueD [Candidatus Reidiella endopervernicosa]